MKFIIFSISFLFLSCITCLSQSLKPEKIKVDDKIEQLTLKSGQVYKDVTVTRISAKGLGIMWSGGIKTIPAKELPKYADLFAEAKKTKPKPTITPSRKKTAEALPKEVKEQWMPASITDVTEACLIVSFISIDKKGKEGKYGGSAFLVNDKGSTYLYSNVHNFFGSRNIKFFFANGEELKLDKKMPVETAYGNYGLNKNMNGLRVGWGGDVVRIKLHKFYKKALTIDNTVLSEEFIGKDIAITGNIRAEGIITELTGKITHLSDYDIINHNVKTEPGNSGSPIVDLGSFKVIGILTWGKYDSRDPLQALWSKGGNFTRTGINSGASLARITYEKCSLKELTEERILLSKIKKSTRLLGLLDTLVPYSDRILVNYGQKVMGDYTVGELMNESPNHYIVKRLLALDRKLKGRQSKVKLSKQDMFKIYLPFYKDCLQNVHNQARYIERYSRFSSFYFKCSLKNTYALEINRAYTRSLGKNLAYYKKQIGTSAKAITFGQRIRLPRHSSGLAGLGLDKE